jgi:hypothetical protein
VGSPIILLLDYFLQFLQGEDGLNQLRLDMDRLRSLGISTNTTCGFHVHADATRGSDQAVSSMTAWFGIQKIASSFLALENAFDLLVGLIDNIVYPIEVLLGKYQIVRDLI